MSDIINDEKPTKEETKKTQGFGFGINSFNVKLTANAQLEELRARAMESLSQPTIKTAFAQHDAVAEFVVIDKGEYNLTYGGVLFIVTRGKEKIVQPWFLETTGNVDTVEQMKDHNGQMTNLTYIKTPSDRLNDPAFAKKIREIVKQKLHIGDDSFKMLPPSIINRTVELAENDQVYRQWLFIAIMNVVSEILIASGQDRAFSADALFSKHKGIQSLDGKDTEYQLNIAVDTDETIQDPLGHPLRNDMTVTLNELFDGDSKPLFKVSAYTDLIIDYDALAKLAQVQSPMGQYGNRNQTVEPIYVPLVMLKNVTPSDHINVNNLEVKLAGLLTGSALITGDSHFLQAFMPRNNVPVEEDMRDVGVLNLDTQLHPSADINGTPEIIDVRGMYNTNPQGFLQYLYNTLNVERVAMGMSVELAGPEYPIERWFSLVTLGDNDTNAKRARDRIVRAMDNLSGGRFSEMAKAEFGELKPTNIAINMGTFYKGTYTANGKKYDLDYLDRLAFYKIKGVTEKDVVDEFGQTLDNPSMSNPAFDMALRYKHQDALAPSDLEIVGQYHRIVFDPRFINVALEAAKAGGMDIVTITDHNRNTAVVRGNRTMANLGRIDSSNRFNTATRTNTGPGNNSRATWGGF